MTKTELLKNLAATGLKSHYGKQPNKEALLRYLWEIKHIIDADFVEYYIMAFWIFRHYATSAEIGVWSHGAMPSSIVCYCLGLTEVDPIKYGLHSARFVNDAPPKFQFDIEASRFDEFMKEAEALLQANVGDNDIVAIRESLFQNLTPMDYLSRKCEKPLLENIDDELAHYALSFPQTMDLYEAYVQQPSRFDGIIYQEQMMDILRETFLVSGIKANNIRLAIQRGETENIEAYKKELFASLKNITKEEAETAWQRLISNPKAFLKAHAVSHILRLHKYDLEAK